MKPKINRTGKSTKSQVFDCCQTPAYALDPLLSYLRPDWIVWESAAGKGRMVRALTPHVRQVVASDILTGQNFFDYQPPAFDAIVTNPPYSIKFDWLERCYQLGKPFAVLVPVEMIGAEAAQRLMKRHGAELLLLSPRVNFEMPIKGDDGSSAQFPTFWLCHQLLPEQIMYGRITRRHDQQLPLLEMAT
jgi:hypothetical protein